MAKLKANTVVMVAVLGFVGIVAVDHFVLKGKLGIAGHFNKLIGQLRKAMGQGAGPIEPATPPSPIDGEGMSPEEMDEQWAQDMELEAESMAKYPD